MIDSVTKSWAYLCIGKCEFPVTKTRIRRFGEIFLSTVRKEYLKNTIFHDWHFCIQNISPSTHNQTAPNGPDLPQCRGFTITLRHTTLGRTPLDDWSDRRRDLYLTKNVPPAVFQTAVLASEWPQTQVLDPVATEIGCNIKYLEKQLKNYSILQKTFCDNGLCSDFFQSNISFIPLAWDISQLYRITSKWNYSACHRIFIIFAT
jgi:hypothetical protein